MSLITRFTRLNLGVSGSVAVVATQIRTATKKVSGSKTNKNDSAGRRLGPKVHEGNFVKPGQIIMRQRGTKIHPGENVRIGRDHTIFAVEPGYVRFYLNPFHPLRKYVGVSLRKDVKLPTPHFEPRVRRFGYDEITNPVAAQKEEVSMSRKEQLQQPELERINAERTAQNEALLKSIASALEEFDITDEEAAKRLLNITLLQRFGNTEADAAAQTTFSYIYQLKLARQRGDISDEEVATQSKKYTELAALVDGKLSVTEHGVVYARLTEEQVQEKHASISASLQEFANRVLSKSDRQTIKELISTPGVFSKEEQARLTQTYLPAVLPETVAETVVEVTDPTKPPKGVAVVRKYDPKTRRLSIVGRTKDAFLA